ncbi:MAG: hypothetical protein ABII22_05395 [Candidatus Micrarchaeota archaeon]
MADKKELGKFIKGSKLKEIISNKKNFVGAKVQYLKNDKTKLMTVKAALKGKAYILTLIVGDDAVDLSLADAKGKLIEHMYHKGSTIMFE